MAIDFDAVLKTVHDLQGKVNDLFNLVGTAREAKFTNKELGEVLFTTEQKQTLVEKYKTLKTDIMTVVRELP